MDKATHKRYLDYRDLHVYFGGKKRLFTPDEFAPLDAEYAALKAKGDERDDEEEARIAALATLLHRD